MSSPYQVTDELYLWWLGQPRTPVLIGALRLLHASRGVSLQYAGGWLRNGFALSEDLPLTDIEHRPVERDTAAGALWTSSLRYRFLMCEATVCSEMPSACATCA